MVNFRNDRFRIVVGAIRKKNYLNTIGQPKYWSGHLMIEYEQVVHIQSCLVDFPAHGLTFCFYC